MKYSLTALLNLAAALLVSAAEIKPNIVFILADDLGWADTTLYGQTKFYKTPNLERLAKRGMTFTHAYAASPLCSPTRSSILTGLSPARTGITAPNCHLPQVILESTLAAKAPSGSKAIEPIPVTRLNTTYVTMAEALKEAGYATGHFGKWHLGAEPYSPLQQGFDVDVPHWPGPGPAGSYVAPWKFKGFDADPGEPHQHIEDRMAKEAVAFMEKHRSEPFFLNYWMFSVHAPFDAKRALIDKYRALANPTNPQRSPTYAAMVESMDDAVGTLLDTLDRLGIADHTMIVFFSDNGGNMYDEVDGTTPTSNAPLRGGKATVYEGGVRVPCIVSYPAVVAAGTRNETVIQSSDFYPTVLETLALKPQANQTFDGISILPAFKGQPLVRDAIFTYFPHSPGIPDTLPPAVTVLAGDWKLIRLFYQGENGSHAYRLYHLKDDIGETQDLAESQPERVKELDAKITQFLSDTKAVVPLPNPAYRASTGDSPAAATDPLDGWKARGCQAAVKDGIVTVTGMGEAPFLGYSAAKSTGPATVTFRIRSTGGGAGKVEWLPNPAAAGEAKSVEFITTPREWQDMSVQLPADGALGIVRLYLPARIQAVQLDWIEIKPTTGKPHRTEF